MEHPFLMFLYHTHPVGLLWTSDQLVAEAATYTSHNKHKRRTSMPSARFELAIPAVKGHIYSFDTLLHNLQMKDAGMWHYMLQPKQSNYFEFDRLVSTSRDTAAAYTHSIAISSFGTRAYGTPTSASSPTPLFTPLYGSIHHRHYISMWLV